MALSPLSLLILFFSFLTSISVQSKSITSPTSPYLSPTTLFLNYQKMLTSFRIYIYLPPKPLTSIFTTPSESLFYTSLLRSPFVTDDPNDAHLFFIPFPSALTTRSLARLVKDLRINFPYWNRTLGADHFYLSSTGVDYSSDRNVVELKKNSVQISSFPTTSGNFIPHKDITLPPVNPSPLKLPFNETTSSLGYMKWNGEAESTSSFIDELNSDPEFVVESGPSDYVGKMMKSASKFHLFMYSGEMSGMVEALASGRVPVVIADRPIQDLPLMDVISWPEIAVFVGTRGGVKSLKTELAGINEVRYKRMRELGVTASKHLVWNAEPQPHDAFHMVVYQLWLRRHTIRYARREWV